MNGFLLCMVPVIGPVEDTVDTMEVNHYYDSQGSEVFTQVIFWEWCDDEFRVVAWRLQKHTSQIPLRDYSAGGWVAIWYDGDTFRRVRSKVFRETWTQHDRELEQRHILPADMRRGLLKERRE